MLNSAVTPESAPPLLSSTPPGPFYRVGGALLAAGGGTRCRSGEKGLPAANASTQLCKLRVQAAAPSRPAGGSRNAWAPRFFASSPRFGPKHPAAPPRPALCGAGYGPCACLQDSWDRVLPLHPLLIPQGPQFLEHGWTMTHASTCGTNPNPAL